MKSKRGLIVFETGETGCGKTGGTAKALIASGSRRFCVCLGLRSLTRQTADAYANDFSFVNLILAMLLVVLKQMKKKGFLKKQLS